MLLNQPSPVNDFQRARLLVAKDSPHGLVFVALRNKGLTAATTFLQMEGGIGVCGTGLTEKIFLAVFR